MVFLAPSCLPVLVHGSPIGPFIVGGVRPLVQPFGLLCWPSSVPSIQMRRHGLRTSIPFFVPASLRSKPLLRRFVRLFHGGSAGSSSEPGFATAVPRVEKLMFSAITTTYPLVITRTTKPIFKEMFRLFFHLPMKHNPAINRTSVNSRADRLTPRCPSHE